MAGLEQESVRYVDEDLVPHESFVGLYSTTETTGQSIANMLKDVCIRFGLSVEYLRGQAYDGASNMSGAYNGAQAILLKEQSLAHYTHCISHSTNSVAGSISSLPSVRDVLSYVNELGKLASNTIKLRNILNGSNEMSNLKKLCPLCPTRWTIRCSAKGNLLGNYSAILAALRQFVSKSTISTEQRSKASGILCIFLRGKLFATKSCLQSVLHAGKVSAGLARPKC